MMPLRFENTGFIFPYNLNLRDSITCLVRAPKISDLAFGGIPYKAKSNDCCFFNCAIFDAVE